MLVDTYFWVSHCILHSKNIYLNWTSWRGWSCRTYQAPSTCWMSCKWKNGKICEMGNFNSQLIISNAQIIFLNFYCSICLKLTCNCSLMCKTREFLYQNSWYWQFVRFLSCQQAAIYRMWKLLYLVEQVVSGVLCPHSPAKSWSECETVFLVKSCLICCYLNFLNKSVLLPPELSCPHP